MGSIPSPSSGEISLGPISIHAYGLMLLLGIVAATWLTGRRWTGRWAFWRDPGGDLVFRVAMWGVLAGIVGARLYHVIAKLEHGGRRVVGALRRLGGRARRLGRHRRRCARRAPGS